LQWKWLIKANKEIQIKSWDAWIRNIWDKRISWRINIKNWWIQPIKWGGKNESFEQYTS
jgi:hypothetical protein